MSLALPAGNPNAWTLPPNAAIYNMAQWQLAALTAQTANRPMAQWAMQELQRRNNGDQVAVNRQINALDPNILAATQNLLYGMTPDQIMQTHQNEGSLQGMAPGGWMEQLNTLRNNLASVGATADIHHGYPVGSPFDPATPGTVAYNAAHGNLPQFSSPNAVNAGNPTGAVDNQGNPVDFHPAGGSGTPPPGVTPPPTGGGGTTSGIDAAEQAQLRRNWMDSPQYNPHGANTWGIQNDTVENLQAAFGGGVIQHTPPVVAPPVTSPGTTPPPTTTPPPSTTPPPTGGAVNPPVTTPPGTMPPPPGITPPPGVTPPPATPPPETASTAGAAGGTAWGGGTLQGNIGYGPGQIRPDSFAVGTNYVPKDQIAQIHQGEAIVPANMNPANPLSQTSGMFGGGWQGQKPPSQYGIPGGSPGPSPSPWIGTPGGAPQSPWAGGSSGPGTPPTSMAPGASPGMPGNTPGPTLGGNSHGGYGVPGPTPGGIGPTPGGNSISPGIPGGTPSPSGGGFGPQSGGGFMTPDVGGGPTGDNFPGMRPPPGIPGGFPGAIGGGSHGGYGIPGGFPGPAQGGINPGDFGPPPMGGGYNPGGDANRQYAQPPSYFNNFGLGKNRYSR